MFKSFLRGANRLVEKVPKPILLRLGHFSVFVGVIGIWTPFLPHIPFFLLALYCYSKSSEKHYQKLLAHPKFGPPLRDWSVRGVISRKTKVVAFLTLLVSLVFSFILIEGTVYRVFLSIFYAAVIIFIFTRPSR